MLKDKITKEVFFDYLESKKNSYNLIMNIYDGSQSLIDLANFENVICQPLYILEDVFFTEIEIDLINWFLYEYDENHMKIWDSKTKEEIANIIDNEALWEYLNRE